MYRAKAFLQSKFCSAHNFCLPWWWEQSLFFYTLLVAYRILSKAFSLEPIGSGRYEGFESVETASWGSSWAVASSRFTKNFLNTVEKVFLFKRDHVKATFHNFWYLSLHLTIRQYRTGRLTVFMQLTSYYWIWELNTWKDGRSVRLRRPGVKT